MIEFYRRYIWLKVFNFRNFSCSLWCSSGWLPDWLFWRWLRVLNVPSRSGRNSSGCHAASEQDSQYLGKYSPSPFPRFQKQDGFRWRVDVLKPARVEEGCKQHMKCSFLSAAMRSFCKRRGPLPRLFHTSHTPASSARSAPLLGLGFPRCIFWTIRRSWMSRPFLARFLSRIACGWWFWRSFQWSWDWANRSHNMRGAWGRISLRWSPRGLLAIISECRWHSLVELEYFWFSILDVRAVDPGKGKMKNGGQEKVFSDTLIQVIRAKSTDSDKVESLQS